MQLLKEEREELFLMKKAQLSLRSMGRKMGRSPSTLSRELRRNSKDIRLGYLPDSAHDQAIARKARHGAKLDNHPKLREYVINKLNQCWSPEMIAGRMKQEGSYKRVCFETIYQFIYGEKGKKMGLFKLLIKGRPHRIEKFSRKKRKQIIPDYVSISERPDAINNREESCFAQLPEEQRKSITFDNGREFIRHTLLRKVLSMATYFTNPHSPWQKGQVEQANAMLHRFIPKKSSIKNLTTERLKAIQKALNSLPRKCLGFRTPQEVFAECQGVALRT